MKRLIIAVKFISVSLIVMAAGGCAFVIKDDSSTKYYGIDQKRGKELLDKVLDIQQKNYQAQQAPVVPKPPE